MGFMWVLLIGLAVYLLYLSSNKGLEQESRHSLESPLDILKMRYARGEISREQFEEMKKDLL